MNRRKYHKIQTQFEKKMKLEERVIDMTSSINHISRKDAMEKMLLRCHLKGVSILSYRQYKKKYPNNKGALKSYKGAIAWCEILTFDKE